MEEELYIEPEDISNDSQAEEQKVYSEEEITELYRLEREKIKQENKEKKLDFPVFKSSLFPNYHNDTPKVENNFNEIMNDSMTKIDENFEKEAKLMRETEELLASLGISFDDKTVVKNDKPEKNANEQVTNQKVVNEKGINREIKPEKQEVVDEYNKRVSRKELKESLKIDNDKKNILRKMKEYR